MGCTGTPTLGEPARQRTLTGLSRLTALLQCLSLGFLTSALVTVGPKGLSQDLWPHSSHFSLKGPSPSPSRQPCRHQ